MKVELFIFPVRDTKGNQFVNANTSLETGAQLTHGFVDPSALDGADKTTILTEENINDINSDADIMVFLSANSMVDVGHISKVKALFAFSEATAVCGPVEYVITGNRPDWIVGDIPSVYKPFKLPSMDNVLTVDISGMQYVYPSIHNIAFTSEAYRSAGRYSAVSNLRDKLILDNTAFIRALERQGTCIYSDSLGIQYSLPESSLTMESLEEQFYIQGFSDGLYSVHETDVTKQDLFWKKFVESPESLEYKVPKWIPYQTDLPEAKKKLYNYNFVTLKTLYNIGFIEASVNRKVI